MWRHGRHGRAEQPTAGKRVRPCMLCLERSRTVKTKRLTAPATAPAAPTRSARRSGRCALGAPSAPPSAPAAPPSAPAAPAALPPAVTAHNCCIALRDVARFAALQACGPAPALTVLDSALVAKKLQRDLLKESHRICIPLELSLCLALTHD